jgi:hypothetical protein
MASGNDSYRETQDIVNYEEIDCASDVEEFEKFINADEAPITASGEFKKDLKEKLWTILKDKSYLFFAVIASVFL